MFARPVAVSDDEGGGQRTNTTTYEIGLGFFAYCYPNPHESEVWHAGAPSPVTIVKKRGINHAGPSMEPLQHQEDVGHPH